MNTKLYLILVIVFLFVFAGCGKEQTTEIEGTVEEETVSESTSETTTSETSVASEEESAETTATSEEEETTDYTLGASEKALLEQRFGPTVRAVLSNPLVKNLHVGDVYVAGLAIRNILGADTRDFVITIKFREAKDFSNSVLPTDDELIQDWLGKNLYIIYTLERSEELILPVIIEVGDTLTYDGDPTVPGTYIYDVYVDYVTSSGATDEYEKLLLTVQVVE